MKTCLELFAGFATMSKEFEKLGYKTFTIDWDDRFDVDMHADISKLRLEDLPEEFRHPDVVFAGTQCTTYSLAAISKHRRKNPVTGTLEPVSEQAKHDDAMNRHVRELMAQMDPKVIIFENPMGGFRKMDFVSDLVLNSTCYCQYGFTYRKQTDFMSNINLHLTPPCRYGDTCHEKAPRGAKTGLQAIKDPAIKSMYPPRLCKHIAKECDEYVDKINGNA